MASRGEGLCGEEAEAGGGACDEDAGHWFWLMVLNWEGRIEAMVLVGAGNASLKLEVNG